MSENNEINTEQLKKEAEKLKKLAEIDEQGRLRDGTSTTEIPGTPANIKAKKLGFEVVEKQQK